MGPQEDRANDKNFCATDGSKLAANRNSPQPAPSV